jgi:orotidine-5'-phosphate decarboxylase
MKKKTDLFVALDFPNVREAELCLLELSPFHRKFKVGLELYLSAGPAFVAGLVNQGLEIFLDLKFHDIPNTVGAAVKQAAQLGVAFTNIHCGGGKAMMAAAREACVAVNLAKKGGGQPTTRLLGVTVLTSLDDKALEEVGFPRSASAQVKRLTDLAQEVGLDGVVCSAQELPLVYSSFPGAYTMVPGIRPSQSSPGDQIRVATPQEARNAGASGLVIGRPITAASDRKQALLDILKDL